MKSKMKWARCVACMGEKRHAYRSLLARCECKRMLGRHRHRWENNIKMDYKEMGEEDVECIQLAQDTVKRQAV